MHHSISILTVALLTGFFAVAFVVVFIDMVIGNKKFYIVTSHPGAKVE
jgi:hypothetical protein